MGPVTGQVTLFSAFSRVLAVIAGLICAFFAVNLFLTGTPATIWHFLPWLLLVAWVLYLVQWRPRLVITADSLVVVNFLREHHIPYPALKSVRVGQGVVLETTAGRIASWGAPGPRKQGPRMGNSQQPDNPALHPQPAPGTQQRIDAAWDAWERAQEGQASPPAPQQVDSRWNRPAAVVSVALLLLVVAATLT